MMMIVQILFLSYFTTAFANIIASPGSCPILPPGTIGTCEEMCSGDEDCDFGQKCCSNGCGHVCKNVTSVTNPGSCPTLRPGTFGICVEMCSDDGDCDQGQKCCSNGCGHVCTDVVSVTHPGTCPTLPPGTIGTCDEMCSGDEECGEGQKCCSNGCGHVCQNVTSATCFPVACKCPYGTIWFKDQNGCDMCTCEPMPDPCATVRCAAETVCQVNPADNTASCVPKCGPLCEQFCPYGHLYDDNGCQQCECAPDPCDNKNCGFFRICKPRKSTCRPYSSTCSEYTGVCVFKNWIG